MHNNKKIRDVNTLVTIGNFPLFQTHWPQCSRRSGPRICRRRRVSGPWSHSGTGLEMGAGTVIFMLKYLGM